MHILLLLSHPFFPFLHLFFFHSDLSHSNLLYVHAPPSTTSLYSSLDYVSTFASTLFNSCFVRLSLILTTIIYFVLFSHIPAPITFASLYFLLYDVFWFPCPCNVFYYWALFSLTYVVCFLFPVSLVMHNYICIALS